VSEEQVRPAIEQFLLTERRRKLVEDDIKALRAAATIQYVGKFAPAAASSAPAGASSSPAAEAAPAPAPTPAASTGGLSATDVSKGLGLK
jgi:hypothetical protein